MRHELKIAALVTTLTLILAGCASSPDSTASLATDAAKSKTASDINAVKNDLDQANSALESTKSDELDWFATEPMKEARKALAEAKEYYGEFALDPSKANSSSGFFSSKTNLEAAQSAITQFNVYLTKAQSIRSSAMTTLESAFDYQAQLTKIGADKYYPNTVKQLDNELKKLVDDIADDKVNAAISAQPDLLVKQRALEVKTITKIYLADAKQQLNQLKQEQIGDYAPKTLAQAAASVTAAEAFINAEPRAISKIKEKAAEAIFAINHAKQVAIAVKQLKALPSSAYENYIVNIEDMLLTISNKLGADDKRDEPISQQGKAIAAFIDKNMKNEQALEQQKNALHDQVKQQKDQIEELAAQIESLNTKLLNKTDYANSLEKRLSELFVKIEPDKATPFSPQTVTTSVKQKNNTPKIETATSKSSSN
ncbi:hypothetical protein MSP8886_03436 [Marinomonas spartinae]|uniref:Chromosome partition protein Smc n=1 Tax=Marinomonas spartinae TaxID=1792290 RepID=A0A1A8TQD9_9GAMM|nr:hypothetical protein [Marinomonas spartinae]SBS35646.1 hypothetical protein MSP8886_03436 [Marinomonas spartinae]